MSRLLILLLLTGCAGRAVVPDPPEPPRVSQCRQHATADLPDAPWFFWELPDFLALAVGTLAEERALRTLEQECIDRLKAEGQIR